MKLKKISNLFIGVGVLLLSGCGSQSDQGAWKIINQTQLKHGANIVGFLNEAYLLDIKGILFFTQDRGKTWTSYSLKLNDNEKLLTSDTPLCAIRFRDASHGTAILGMVDNTGKKFIAMQTKNGGKTWKRTDLPISVGYASSIFLAHDGVTLTHFDAANNSPVTLLQYQAY